MVTNIATIFDPGLNSPELISPRPRSLSQFPAHKRPSPRREKERHEYTMFHIHIFSLIWQIIDMPGEELDLLYFLSALVEFCQNPGEQLGFTRSLNPFGAKFSLKRQFFMVKLVSWLL